MRLRRPSVRARLTLWHAGVLTLIVCIFSAGILLFVKARLYAGLDAQLDREIATIGKIYREEPEELKDLASHWGITLFQVDEAGGIRQQTEAWEREGLSRALQPDDAALPLSWTAPSGRRYRVHSVSESSYRVAAAVEETSLRDTLWTLAVILAMGIPFAAGLAIAGGYFLAGRVLSPVGAMAQKAREITAESLAKRLPVDNAQDEFGRLATVFNDTLSRLQDAFDRLRRFTADASHELRTPLTAMRSVGEVALQNTLDAVAYRDVIGSMLEEVDWLTRLVESLLILTRANSGKVRLVPEALDLGGLVGHVIDQLRVLADEKQQELTLRAPIRVHATARRRAHPSCAHEFDTQCDKIHPEWRHDHRRSECDGRAGHDRGTRHGTGDSCRASGSYFRSLLSRRRQPLQGRGRGRTGARNRSLGG